MMLNAQYIIYSCKYSKRKPNLNLLFVALQHVKKSKRIFIAKLNENDTFSSYLYKLQKNLIN